MSAGTIAWLSVAYVVIGCLAAYISLIALGDGSTAWACYMIITWPIWLILLPLILLGRAVAWLAEFTV